MMCAVSLAHPSDSVQVAIVISLCKLTLREKNADLSLKGSPHVWHKITLKGSPVRCRSAGGFQRLFKLPEELGSVIIVRGDVERFRALVLHDAVKVFRSQLTIAVPISLLRYNVNTSLYTANDQGGIPFQSKVRCVSLTSSIISWISSSVSRSPIISQIRFRFWKEIRPVRSSSNNLNTCHHRSAA